jgi:predicted CopG family antitoxin
MIKEDIEFLLLHKIYKDYNYYILMENTTIAIPKNLRDEIKEFGLKSEKFSDILNRLLKSAKERQLYDLLMDESGTVTIEEAMAEANQKWSK